LLQAVVVVEIELTLVEDQSQEEEELVELDMLRRKLLQEINL
jgi:hypothetical protein